MGVHTCRMLRLGLTSSRSSTVISPNPDPSCSPSFWPRFTCRAATAGSKETMLNVQARGAQAARQAGERGVSARMMAVRSTQERRPACLQLLQPNSTCRSRDASMVNIRAASVAWCAGLHTIQTRHNRQHNRHHRLPCLRDLLPEPPVALVVLLPHVPRVLARALHAVVHVLLGRRAAAAAARLRPPTPKPVVAAGGAVAHLLHRRVLLLLVVQGGAAPAHLAALGEVLGGDAGLRRRGFGRGGCASRSAWQGLRAAGEGERRRLAAPSPLRFAPLAPCAAGPPPPETCCLAAWLQAPQARCRRAGPRAARRG